MKKVRFLYRVAIFSDGIMNRTLTINQDVNIEADKTKNI